MSRTTPSRVAEVLKDRQRKPLELTFTQPLYSKNDRDKWHWTKRHRHRQEWTRLIALRYPYRGQPPDSKQLVTITRHLAKGQRLWDNANGYGGSSIELVDALKAAGYLIDDGPRWCEVRFTQDDQNRDGETRVTVRLELVLKEVL